LSKRDLADLGHSHALKELELKQAVMGLRLIYGKSVLRYQNGVFFTTVMFMLFLNVPKNDRGEILYSLYSRIEWKIFAQCRVRIL
jgi:hypothetical protein